MDKIKNKFKGYSYAAWVVLVGGVIVFGYGIKEVVLETYDEWPYPVGAIVLGFVLMRYPSLLASLFKLKTGTGDRAGD